MCRGYVRGCCGFTVRAGLARGCVKGLCDGLQGRCAQQGSQQAGLFVTRCLLESFVSFLPAFMCFSPWKTGGMSMPRFPSDKQL